MIDRNDVVRICGSKADLEHLMRAHPGVQGNPPPAKAVGVDQGMHFAVKPRLRQHFDDEIALPRAVGFGLPVLDRATAADTEMLAKWRDPFGACALDPEQAPAIGMMTRHRCDLDGLAAKRVGHIDVLAVDKGDAVAEMTDVVDDEALNHGARR